MNSDRARPLVTIAIPTYNRADRFLRPAIDAALQQTYPNIEVIISDNCSTDDTETVVRSYKDSRIRYFRQERNIGANNNFNFCLEQASGDYFLLFLDDDQIDADLVECCMDAANDRTDVGVIRTGTRTIDEDGKVIKEVPNRAADLSFCELLLAWFRSETTFYLCSTLINTQGLREVGGFHSRHNLFQDVGAELKVAARYGRVDVEAVKAGFRLHDANMGSAARIQAWCEDSLELLDILCELCPERRESIRKEGLRFLCRMNYSFVRSIPSPLHRMRSYLQVARNFGEAEPLMGYLYRKEVRPFLRALKNG